VGNWSWAKQNEFDNSLIKFETSDGMSLRYASRVLESY